VKLVQQAQPVQLVLQVCYSTLMSSGWNGKPQFVSNINTHSVTGSTGVGTGYSYYGCYVQTGSGTIGDLALGLFNGVNAADYNFNCFNSCRASGYNFAGSVNAGPATGTCYCDNILTLRTNSGTSEVGRVSDNDCGRCDSGFGECGDVGLSIAVYARNF
jgi:hypothetical protein